MEVTVKNAKELLVDCLKSGLVPFLGGSPGLGKSAIIHEIADEYGLEVIDLRLSQCDPTDLSGFPTVNKETGKAGYKPMDTFPLDTDEIPEGRNGWLLFLDEFNSAPMSVQSAAYKLVLDKKIGQQNMHKNCVIMCAGNLESDNAITNRLSTAMQSRLVHLEMTVSVKDWIEWADGSDVDYRVKAYINFKPEMLHQFDPEHNDKTFPCARTWEFVSKLVSKWKEITYEKLPLLAGTIGEGAAREFTTFCSIFEDLPTIEDVIRNPVGIPMSEEPSVLYALSGMLSNHADEKNIDKIMDFVNRMPIEFQVITLKSILASDPAIVKSKGVTGWITKNAAELQ